MNCIARNVKMMKILLRTKVELIHANSHYALVITVLPTFVARKRLIWHARDLIRCRLLARMCGRFCSRIVAVSQAVKDHLASCGIKPAKIEVVYNGTELPSSHPAESSAAPASLLSHDGRIVFANVGQFVPWKHQSLFLAAAAQVARRMPNAAFWLVGDDIFERDSRYKQTLLNDIGRLGLLQRVSILGWQTDMSWVWRKLDCLVHTATREPFGRVVIEAMAHRLPVIAVDDGGPREIIQDGKTGLLVPPQDSEQLAQAMLKMARNPGLANSMGKAGFDHVAAAFSAEKTAQRIAAIYEEILAS